MRSFFGKALRVLGLGSDVQFALVTLGGIGLIVAFVGGVLYLVGLFPWWINLLLILSTLVLSAGAFLEAASWWWTRDARLYYAQLSLDRPAIRIDIDLEHERALVQPHIELANHMPERLDYQMLEFTAKVGHRTGAAPRHRGSVLHDIAAGFAGGTIEVPIRAGSRIDVIIGYDIVYGPSAGNRYLIRERREGLILGGVVAADGTFATDQNYTATQPPVTEIIKRGLPR